MRRQTQNLSRTSLQGAATWRT